MKVNMFALKLGIYHEVSPLCLQEAVAENTTSLNAKGKCIESIDMIQGYLWLSKGRSCDVASQRTEQGWKCLKRGSCVSVSFSLSGHMVSCFQFFLVSALGFSFYRPAFCVSLFTFWNMASQLIRG